MSASMEKLSIEFIGAMAIDNNLFGVNLETFFVSL
jgi:hypothetical protein